MSARGRRTDTLKTRWEADGNPYWVWVQIGICCRWSQDFPDWVLSYLAQCAERMIPPPDAARERDLRKVLPKIFGFPKNSRGQDLMMDAPAEVTERQLRDLSLAVRKA